MVCFAIVADLAGKWTGSLKTPDGNEFPLTYNFHVSYNFYIFELNNLASYAFKDFYKNILLKIFIKLIHIFF